MGDGEKRRQRKSKRDGGRIERERDRERGGGGEREQERVTVYKPSINAFIGFAAHTHVCVCALLCLPVRPGARLHMHV